MTLPSHVLGVELIKLTLRSKDPLPSKFYCHTCKNKYTVALKSTSPRPKNCTLCNSEFIEWIVPEDPHQRAARLREVVFPFHSACSSPSLSPSPSPSPSPPPRQPKEEEPMETEAVVAPPNIPSITKTDAETGKSTSAEAMDEEPSAPPPPKKTAPPPPPMVEEEDEESEEEEPRHQSPLTSQPMLMISAGGDPKHPTLTLNLFPSLDEAGPRKEGRRGALRTVIIQQDESRNFTYLAQEYLAQIVGRRSSEPGAPPRRQQLLVGLTGGAQTGRSDPADFVWGARGLDTIISGLLGTMSDQGPPPAKKENVDALPVVIATEEVVEKYTDGCTVCKDSFKVEESLRKLPCEHLFHEKCIIPWLKRRDTCPSCRYHVNKDKSEEKSEAN